MKGGHGLVSGSTGCTLALAMMALLTQQQVLLIVCDTSQSGACGHGACPSTDGPRGSSQRATHSNRQHSAQQARPGFRIDDSKKEQNAAVARLGHLYQTTSQSAKSTSSQLALVQAEQLVALAADEHHTAFFNMMKEWRQQMTQVSD